MTTLRRAPAAVKWCLSVTLAVATGNLGGCAATTGDVGQDKDDRDHATRGTPDSGSVTAVEPDLDGGALPHQGCADADSASVYVAPDICSWLNSFDLVVAGEITSIASSEQVVAVDVDRVRTAEAAIRELDVEEKFPWLEEAPSAETEGKDYAVVDSCPVGLQASNERWSIGVESLPSLEVTLQPELVLGAAAADGPVALYVGWMQYTSWDGPRIDEVGQVSGSQLAPRTRMLAGLTLDTSGTFLTLGYEVPAAIEGDAISSPVQNCAPKRPAGLDGLSLDELKTKHAECVADSVSARDGKKLHDARSRAVSAPTQVPHFAAECHIRLHDKVAEAE